MKKLVVLLLYFTTGFSLVAQNDQAKVSVVPDRFLRGYDPITVFYDQNVGPERGGPADGPSPYLRISPSPSGEYKWLDARTIQFLPASAWPVMSQITVEANGKTTNLFTMLSPPTNLSPASGSNRLDPISEVLFTFPVEVDVPSLKKLIQFEVRTFPGLTSDNAYWLGENDFQVSPLERKVGTQTTYKLTLARPIGYGKTILMRFKLALDASVKDTLVTYSFDTKPDFTVVSMGGGGVRLPLPSNGAVYKQEQAVNLTSNASVYLEFSESIAGVNLETLKKLVQFEPTVRNLNVSSEGSVLRLTFEADRGTPYKVSFTYQPLKSVSNRTLVPFGASAFYFYFQRASSFLTWKTSDGLVERFGPQILPLEGRQTNRVDLRVYKIDPLSLNFWPFPASPVSINEQVRPPMPGQEPAYGNDLANQIRLIGSPQISKIVDLPVSENSGRTSFGLDLKNELSAAFGAEEPGTYLVGYRTLGASNDRVYVRLNVTDLSLSVVEEEDALNVLVTSIKTGAPVPSAKIQFQSFKDKQPIDLVVATTDSTGQYRYRHSKALPDAVRRVVVSKGQDVLVLNPAMGLPVFSNNHWSSGGSSWLSWLTSDARVVKHEAVTKAYLLTERPIYKPEESVYFVGWIRDRADGTFRSFVKEPVVLAIQSPSGQQWLADVKLNEFGRFSYEFKEENLPTGLYNAQVLLKKSGRSLYSLDFRKEAYRVPLFQVDLSGPDFVALDKPFEVLLTAEYYAGGRVVGEQVQWAVSQYPYSVSASRYPGYLFSTDERMSGSSSFSSIGSGSQTAQLDQDGSARLTLNPSAETDGRARRYVVVASVVGADRQTVTQTKQIVALPPFSIGLKIDRVLKNAREIKPSIVVLDHLEKPLAGVPVTVKLWQRQWHSYVTESDFSTGEARYASDVVDVPVWEKSFVSTDGELSPSIPVSEAGVYVVETSSHDYLGRLVVVKTDTFVSGSTPVSWEKKNDNVFELSTDKTAYNPGDVAKIVLKSPFQTGYALVVVEQPRENAYKWVKIEAGSAIVEWKIDETMAPALPVAALLMRGRLDSQAPRESKLDLGKPLSVGASLSIRVLPKAHQAIVKLTHEAKRAPATNLAIDVTLTDPDGKPLDGEVALWLVDRAVLALGKEKPIDPLGAFIDPVRSWIRISDSRNLSLGWIPVQEVPGGDGSESEEAMLADLLGKTTVRKNFKTVPYFNPGIEVKDGKATISVALPDNLTDFAIRAVAVSGLGRFAVAKSSVSVRLPIMVQQTLPRFVRPADKTTTGGTARVVEGSGGPAEAAIAVRGIALVGADPEKALKKIVLDDKKAQSLAFPMQVPPGLVPGTNVTVSLYLKRLSDDARDAFSIELPVRPDTDRKTSTKTTKVVSDVPLTFAPPETAYRPGSVVRELIVSTDERLSTILKGVSYLQEYPFGCSEQRTSKLYPSILLQQIGDVSGIPGVKPLSPALLGDYFEYLESCQDQNGYYGFWPHSQGSVSLTSYILQFLRLADRAKYKVPVDQVDKASRALERALRTDSTALLSAMADLERVEALYALALGGTVVDSYLNDLVQKSKNFPIYAQAKLYAILVELKRDRGDQAQALLQRLRQTIVTKQVAGKEVFSGIAADWKWFQPVLLTETRTIAAVLNALRKDTQSERSLNLMVDYLLGLSGDRGWGSTIENVDVTAALLAWIKDSTTSKEIGFNVAIDGKIERRTLGKVKIVQMTIVGENVGNVSTTGVDASHPLYFTIRTTYTPLAIGSKAVAENKGFVVRRSLDSKTMSFPIDTVVEEHVQVVCFEDQSFVAVTVPLAAGMEPLNPNLATSGPEARPSRPLTLEPTYSIYGDDQVTFFYNRLAKGTYDFYFRERASFEGTYTLPRAKAELMYDQGVWGASEGFEVKVTAP